MIELEGNNMITVLAKNNGKYGVIELPALEGQLKKFCADMKVENVKEINIQYAGTGTYRHIDVPLVETILETERVGIDEVNLLSYLFYRMSDNQLEDYCRQMYEYSSDLKSISIDSFINEAYEILKPGTEVFYNGNNIDELISVERKRSAIYQEMNKDVFWKMIDLAKKQCGDDYKSMERVLIDQLSNMNPQDIVEYYRINSEYIRLANREGVYDVGCELNKFGLGDDGFVDFRGWLIGQGKDVYMQAMKEPKSIVELGLKPRNGEFSWETFNYIPSYAYTANTGEDMYCEDLDMPEEQQREIADEIDFGESNTQYHESELEYIMKNGL